MSVPVNPPRRRESYTVGIICTVNVELSAVRYLFDFEHPSLSQKPGDLNLYILGELSGHNVVLAWLSGNQGKSAAATVAANLKRSFLGIEWLLVVGTAGGVPSRKHDIRLGDVVIGMPEGLYGGVVQYDLGKDEEKEFTTKGYLVPSPSVLRGAAELMCSNHLLEGNRIEEFVLRMRQKGPRFSEYQRPPSEDDLLFPADYSHGAKSSSCAECDKKKVITRRPRDFPGPEIHYGLVASGDRVMRSATKRQAIVNSIGDILCFEMESAGVAGEYACLTIRGISNYADSHKNDIWEPYAVAAAAAVAKELLLSVPRRSHSQRETESCINDLKNEDRTGTNASNMGKLRM